MKILSGDVYYRGSEGSRVFTLVVSTNEDGSAFGVEEIFCEEDRYLSIVKESIHNFPRQYLRTFSEEEDGQQKAEEQFGDAEAYFSTLGEWAAKLESHSNGLYVISGMKFLKSFSEKELLNMDYFDDMFI